MPRASPIKDTFNAGEFSPRMDSRVGFGKYPNGCATLLNMVPLVQGGIMRRPGTRFVAETKDSSAKPRGLRFEFSTDQAYVIEAGDQYFRFFRNQGQITSTDIAASITNGTFDANINNWTDESGAASSIAFNAGDGDGFLQFASNGSTDAHAEQQVTNALAVAHSLRFRVRGTPHVDHFVRLRVGTSTKGTQIVDDVKFSVGWHVHTFTATAANFFVQFIFDHDDNTWGVDDISITDDSAIEITTPYTTAQLAALRTAQTADVMYITHGSHHTYKLVRFGHTTWSLIMVPWDDGPYIDANTTTTTLNPGAASGHTITIVASSVDGINDGRGFISTDVCRLIRMTQGSNEPGWAIIQVVTNTTTVVVDVERTFGASAAVTTWSLGAWSDTTGHPQAIGFFEQRLAAGRTTDQPQTFWLSQSADIENMRADSFVASAIAVEDDDSLAYTFAAEDVNSIQWISGGRQLAIGTAGGVWIAESDGITLTPTDIQCRRHTTNAAAAVAPVRIDDVVVYVQRAKRKINEFIFVFESDGYQAPDMTILADHITKSGINELVYAEEPHSIVWGVREDGVIAAMTFRRGEDVVGWARLKIGGKFNTGDAVVESVMAIPGNATTESTDRDEVWVFVKRTIDGSPARYVEFFEGDFVGPERHDFASDDLHTAAIIEAQKDAFYVDGGLSLDSPETVSGATKADPVVVTITSTALADGDEVEIAEVIGMIELNGVSFFVANKAANTVELVSTAGAVDITGATKADPGVITAVDHGFSNDDLVGIFDVVGMTELNGIIFKVSAATDDTFAVQTPAGVDVDTTGFTTYVSGGKIYHAIDGTAFTTYSSDGVAREKVTAISGLDHLEGETVKILADGAVHPDKTVSSGAITLDYRAGRIHVGLGYTYTFRSLKINAGTAAGTAVGKVKRVNNVGLVLLDAAATQIGPNDSALQDVTFREVGDAMDTAVPLFTGEILAPFDADFERDQRIVIQNDIPSPFTLLALTPEMKSSDPP